MRLVLVGAGGFGREVSWQMRLSPDFAHKYDLTGFVDDRPELKGQALNGLPVVGTTASLLETNEEVAVALCIGTPRVRKSIALRLSTNPLISFPTLIAHDVQYSDSVRFGKGCIICLSTVCTVNIRIGDFAIVNLDCTIGHDAVIEDFVTLNPSVNVSGNVSIGAATEIGTGTSIRQGMRIGKNTMVGAGAAVVKDLPAHCTAVGVPAVPIKMHEAID